MIKIVPTARRYQLRYYQRGVTLFIALVGLIAMALAGVALVRSVETNNIIAGNMAFRNAAMHASDVGVEAAFTALNSITSGQIETSQPNSCTNACQYYATMQPLNSLGVPSTVAWANVAGVAINTDYTVRYVIERLCAGALPIADLASSCYAGSLLTPGSKKFGSQPLSAVNELYYRVTVRVEGPRNTVSYVQTIISY